MIKWFQHRRWLHKRLNQLTDESYEARREAASAESEFERLNWEIASLKRERDFLADLAAKRLLALKGEIDV